MWRVFLVVQVRQPCDNRQKCLGGPSNSVLSYQESNGTNFLTMNQYLLESAEMSPEEPVCLFVFKEGQREGGRTEPSAQGLVGLSLALRGGLPWWVGLAWMGVCLQGDVCKREFHGRETFGKKAVLLNRCFSGWDLE